MTAHSCTKHDPGRDVCYIWHGCRCRQCTKAHTRTNEECRLRKLRGVTGFTSGIGTQRRIRALMAAGWGLRKIADHMGITKSAVGRLCRDPLPRVTITLARRVIKAYDDLWRGPDYCDRGVMRTQLYAARRGWPPPLAWDDGHGPHGIDNPTSRPANAPDPASLAHRPDELARLLDAGESPEQAVLQCGWPSHQSALVWLHRHGHTDLARRIQLDRALMRKLVA